MSILRSILYGIILLSFSTHALQLSLESTDTGTQIMVSNDQDLHDVDVYLVWFNLDAEKDIFKSLMASSKWKKGLLPVYSKPIDISSFESFKAADFDEPCPEDQRCFLALVAVEAGENPVDSESWQASTLLPLSLAAGRERLPGQQFFLANDYVNRYNLPMGAIDESAPEDGGMEVVSPALSPTSDTAKTTEAGADITTEKPDIFRLVGNKLLYANEAAKRFQVIDVSDVSNPSLIGWTALSGNPKELYVLNDYYILLQINYDGGFDEPKTELIVLQQGDGNILNTVQEMSIPGRFIESRRRGNFIYSVSQEYSHNNYGFKEEECAVCNSVASINNKNHLTINVLELKENGKLELVDETKILGYSPQIAIFSDNLVIANHNPEEEKWQTTQIQVFDLTQSDPLVEFPQVKVPGQVPSEFHLSVLNQQLRVVYGPEDRTDGSTLAIYNLSPQAVSLVGKVDKIAPGEGLFATRFVNDTAYVVTYERTDPLWVIDLSDSSNPTILGELIIPGWSEKMFFHENRLFAVGIDDQAKENEEFNRARRVAVSLFNVEDPTKPTLINRITPLVGQTSHSWSPALDDERALLLNWQDSFAALPINSWYQNSNNHLQIVSFADDKLKDVGLLSTPTDLQRSLMLDSNILAGLGNQSLVTLSWGVDKKPEILAELELATNLTWLQQENGYLWSAARGNQGYHRFYRYNTNDLETPEQNWSLMKGDSWSLKRGYNNLVTDDAMVVFYNQYEEPLGIQILDKNTGELSPPLQLFKNAASHEKQGIPADDVWYDRRSPLLHEGILYIAEQRSFKPSPNMILPMPEKDYWQSQWILRSWNLQANESMEAPIRSIPGEPLAITASGDLITKEWSENKQQRLNLLALKENNAVLLGDYYLQCDGYSTFMWADNTLYTSCRNEPDYNEPIRLDEPMLIETMSDEASSDEVEVAEVKSTRDSQDQPVEEFVPTTQITQLSPTDKGFVEVGSWTFPNWVNLQSAIDGVVLLSLNNYWPYHYASMGKLSIAPIHESDCNVYQLIPEQEPVLLKNLETCFYNNDGMVMTPEQIWTAEGYAGIKNTKF
ncbi:beta-propeller domain-containing protein [Candidatus Halobeggiatoa sp. HSG11]|nr:beta-propeller domain-containing protein [Candidatus Halobeggiatoa sp. HSG11]